MVLKNRQIVVASIQGFEKENYRVVLFLNFAQNLLTTNGFQIFK